MNEYLKIQWWGHFNMDLYLRVLEAKAKRENLVKC